MNDYMNHWFIPENPHIKPYKHYLGIENPKDVLRIIYGPTMVFLVMGKSLKAMCKNSKLGAESLALSYFSGIELLMEHLHVRPMECGIQATISPDGRATYIPELKWVPLHYRDPSTGDYVWCTVDGKRREPDDFYRSTLSGKKSVATPWISQEFGLYMTCHELYDQPLRMRNYRVVLTVEAVCPDVPRTLERAILFKQKD